MFPTALVVTVVDELVTLAVRTDDARVDVFDFTTESFPEFLAFVRLTGNEARIHFRITDTYSVVFSVDRPTFATMVAQYNAQVGGG